MSGVGEPDDPDNIPELLGPWDEAPPLIPLTEKALQTSLKQNLLDYLFEEREKRRVLKRQVGALLQELEEERDSRRRLQVAVSVLNRQLHEVRRALLASGMMSPKEIEHGRENDPGRARAGDGGLPDRGLPDRGDPGPH